MQRFESFHPKFILQIIILLLVKYKKKNFVTLDFCFSNNQYYNVLSDILLFKRYLRRQFGYSVSFSINTNTLIKQKKIVLLKSPFVHKIAQEQFCISYFFKFVSIKFNYIFINLASLYWILKVVKKTFFKSGTSPTKMFYSFMV